MKAIYLSILLLLSGCITLNVNDILGSNKCDYLLKNSQDIKQINKCIRDEAILYAASGHTTEAIKSCKKLLDVRAGELTIKSGGSILLLPIDYMYDVIYPVWMYKTCIISVAKISRDKHICRVISTNDYMIYGDPKVRGLYTELVNYMQKGTDLIISGPGGLVDYLWPGLTEKDCKKEVEVIKERDRIANKPLLDILNYKNI